MTILPSTLDFLKSLKQNNTREWFAEHKEDYEQARNNFKDLVNRLLQQLVAFDEQFGMMKAEDTMFRIYRDVRFSKDKSPYKPHFSAYFCKGGKNSEMAGYYIHIEPDANFFIGGGKWMPQGDLLKKIRQEIDYNIEDFLQIIGNKDFKKYFTELEGERLKTIPKGYAADHPHLEIIKLKSFIASCTFSEKDVLSENFDAEVIKRFKVMQPLIDFLNQAMDS
ncbi:MAG: DUF2461 domain-containing protein [Thermoflexibacter sp.]|jgi:uncharacterized protein (TIGR02453 family)|nr:DUF2461 domain-containing protein [Thermoflexibacter sp.]